MNDMLKAVQELEKIRKIPQFIFIARIWPPSTLRIRREIQEFAEKNPNKKEIDFILESPGGSADHAYIMIRILRDHFEKVNIIVPFWAKSAATLFALGGSEIIMDEFGEFGPLDVQVRTNDELPDAEPQSGLIDEYSLTTIENRAMSLYRRMLLKLLKEDNNPEEIDIRLKKTVLSEQVFNHISNLYRPLFEKIDPYQIGEKARSLAIAERYAERILNQYNKENMKEDIEYFIDYMVHECPDHGYNIDYSIMKLFLANVKKASEISEDYCKALTKLSMLLFKNPGSYIPYIGFFDKKLLENKEEIKDTNNRKNTVVTKSAGKEKKDERSKKRR